MTKEEAILEGRRRFEAGEFNRKVIKSVPETFGWDTVHPSCGHNQPHNPKLWSDKKEELPCHECTKAWIKANTNENQK